MFLDRKKNKTNKAEDDISEIQDEVPETEAYHSAQEESIKALRKQLEQKTKELENSWTQSSQDKLAVIQERFSVVRDSGVLDDIPYIFQNSWYWQGLNESKETDWNYKEYLRQFVFATSFERGHKKEFETYVELLKTTSKSEQELISSIGIKKSNVELFLYRRELTPYDDEYEFGTIEVIQDSNVVLECGCSRTLGNEFESWKAMSIHYASDVDWIQSVKEFKEHLIHQEKLDKLEGEIGSEDFLINRHKT
jgi:hypothetical protein